MTSDRTPLALPFTFDVHIPPHSADGVCEIRDAAGRLVAIVDPSEELGDAESVTRLASSICDACNVHERLVAVCEAIQESFDANGDYRYHTAEYSIADLVAMSRDAVAEAMRK